MQIQSWDDVDKALLEIGEAERRMARCQGDADQAIASAKAHLAAALKPLVARRKVLLAEIEEFVRAHEAEMDGRHRALIHGRVWLRKVTSVTARSWKRVLDWLLERKKMEYVRVSHEVNKEALRGAPDLLLKACGARLTSEDKFGHELSEAIPK